MKRWYYMAFNFLPALEAAGRRALHLGPGPELGSYRLGLTGARQFQDSLSDHIPQIRGSLMRHIPGAKALLRLIDHRWTPSFTVFFELF